MSQSDPTAAVLTAKGVGGQVQFDGSFVTIGRKGFLGFAKYGRGEKRIPIGAITAVEWRDPKVRNGYVR